MILAIPLAHVVCSSFIGAVKNWEFSMCMSRSSVYERNVRIENPQDIPHAPTVLHLHLLMRILPSTGPILIALSPL